MRNLTAIAAMLIAANGCAPVPRVAAPQPEIVIDFEQRTIRAPEWQTALIDCSDAQYQCIESPGHFLMAFPRICPTDG
jgi:hypothetical protein